MPTVDPFQSVLDAARSGAEWAWSRLVNDLDGRLRGYVRRQGGVDADDLVGETWLHVARGLHRFEGDENAFRSWVFMIAHHRIIDERRRRRRKPTELREQAVLDRLGPSTRSAESKAIESRCETRSFERYWIGSHRPTRGGATAIRWRIRDHRDRRHCGEEAGSGAGIAAEPRLRSS